MLGPGFRALGFRIQSLRAEGWKVYKLGFRVWGLGLSVKRLGLRIYV